MWPFSHDDTKDEDWTRLNITGPHGLFAVVMSTSWWASSTDLNNHCTVFNAAVADLHWVIKKLIPSSSGNQPEVDTGPVKKFPGHCERAPGKRRVKPTPKASSRP